jgi:hypothetical protein
MNDFFFFCFPNSNQILIKIIQFIFFFSPAFFVPRVRRAFSSRSRSPGAHRPSSPRGVPYVNSFHSNLQRRSPLAPLTVLRTALLLAATTHTPMAMVRRMARHRLLRTRRIQTATVPLLHRLAGATVVVRAKAAMVAVRKVATAVVATVVVVRVATVVATVVVKVALVVAVVAKGSARTCRNSSGTRALCKW